MEQMEHKVWVTETNWKLIEAMRNREYGELLVVLEKNELMKQKLSVAKNIMKISEMKTKREWLELQLEAQEKRLSL